MGLQVLVEIVNVIRLVAAHRAFDAEVLAHIVEIPESRLLQIVVGDAADGLQVRAAPRALVGEMRVDAVEGAIEVMTPPGYSGCFSSTLCGMA